MFASWGIHVHNLTIPESELTIGYTSFLDHVTTELCYYIATALALLFSC